MAYIVIAFIVEVHGALNLHILLPIVSPVGA
jgi:hypothetical protein